MVLHHLHLTTPSTLNYTASHRLGSPEGTMAWIEPGGCAWLHPGPCRPRHGVKSLVWCPQGPKTPIQKLEGTGFIWEMIIGHLRRGQGTSSRLSLWTPPGGTLDFAGVSLSTLGLCPRPGLGDKDSCTFGSWPTCGCTWEDSCPVLPCPVLFFFFFCSTGV
jgi:hypothetical protein